MVVEMSLQRELVAGDPIARRDPAGHGSGTWTGAASVGKRQDLLTPADLLATGQVTPIIDRTHPLDDAADALRYVGGRPHPREGRRHRLTTGPTRTTQPVRMHAQTRRHRGGRPLLSEEEPMTIGTNTPNLLDTPPAPVQAKLAAAWTSFMFLYIYVDLFNFYKPGAVDEIRDGVIFEFDISPTLLTIFLASVAIPTLMVMLSTTLPARVNRATNLVVALLYIPFSVFNAVGESWAWASFYGLSIGIEVLLLAFILRSAWKWPRTPAVPAGPATTDLRQ
jgi:Family of unknown function (DUF6326)